MSKHNNSAKTPPEESYQFQTKEGFPFDIPVEGSLGLLALGDLGLLAWRQKRTKFKEELADRTQKHLETQQP